MNQPKIKPNSMPWVTPYVAVSDVKASVEFYKKVFGFKTTFTLPDDNGKLVHAELTWHDQMIMLGDQTQYTNGTVTPNDSNTNSPIVLYLYHDDVEAFYKHATTNGAESVLSPEDTFWGDRMCRVKDRDGYVWSFATLKPDAKPCGNN